MREISIAALYLILCGCAGERTVVEEKLGQLEERWHGAASIPLPVPQSDGTVFWDTQKVLFDLTREQRTKENSNLKEETLSRADLAQILKDMATITKPIVNAASGSWVGVAGEVGGWILATLLGGKAIHSQVKVGSVGKAFKQTVDGLNAVRASVGDETWKATIAPHLEKHQDEDVRTSLK